MERQAIISIKNIMLNIDIYYCKFQIEDYNMNNKAVSEQLKYLRSINKKHKMNLKN